MLIVVRENDSMVSLGCEFLALLYKKVFVIARFVGFSFIIGKG